MKVLTGRFSYSPVARHYTVFKGKINESSVVSRSPRRESGDESFICRMVEKLREVSESDSAGPKRSSLFRYPKV
jgi:hypothetical protein